MLGTVTKAVETVETVIVVVGSSVGTGVLDVGPAAGANEELAVAEVDSKVVRGLDVAIAVVVEAEGANVASAAAPVKVVKPAVAPLNVADMVTKMMDVGGAACAVSEEEASAAVVLSPADNAAADELAVIWTVVVPIVVVPLMVAPKLPPDPSVDVPDEEPVLEAAASVVDEGKDWPLAGIGMTLVEIALVAAARVVCEA